VFVNPPCSVQPPHVVWFMRPTAPPLRSSPDSQSAWTHSYGNLISLADVDGILRRNATAIRISVRHDQLLPAHQSRTRSRPPQANSPR